MPKIIWKYHGGGYGGSWPHIPAYDLTQAKIDELKISEKEIVRSGLYEKAKETKTKSERKVKKSD